MSGPDGDPLSKRTLARHSAPTANTSPTTAAAQLDLCIIVLVVPRVTTTGPLRDCGQAARKWASGLQSSDFLQSNPSILRPADPRLQAKSARADKESQKLTI